ncbi:LytR/AlgR family response regulator transcription factor [Mitsuokella jalaludinii]|uniref:LytR/AlgR family response regulator transcription factor n=1 Tax=Mitsuokella jalaludinii TaxID=187979 RepID=UPI0029E50C0B|nr:LytTR family DNA-binding domain-containing protein [Selenomonadaceae bacterium]
MLRIAICDDQAEQIALIRAAAEKYFQSKREYISYESFEQAFAFIDAIERGAIFDIVLLDVCMPGLSGIDAAAELRKHHNRTEIIFLTTSDEFAVDAFAVKATDYLLKPFTQSQFNRAMERAISCIRQRNSAKMVFRLTGGGIQVEELTQILYLENHGHIIRVYLGDGTMLETRKSMQEMKDHLDKIAPGQFLSPHKGYLVNLKAIHLLRPEYVEIQGHKIPLGKRKYRDFQEQYFQFMFVPAGQ